MGATRLVFMLPQVCCVIVVRAVVVRQVVALRIVRQHPVRMFRLPRDATHASISRIDVRRIDEGACPKLHAILHGCRLLDVKVEVVLHLKHGIPRQPRTLIAVVASRWAPRSSDQLQVFVVSGGGHVRTELRSQHTAGFLSGLRYARGSSLLDVATVRAAECSSRSVCPPEVCVSKVKCELALAGSGKAVLVSHSALHMACTLVLGGKLHYCLVRYQVPPTDAARHPASNDGSVYTG